MVVSVMANGRPYIATADTASAPSLVISQLKITSSNGQFVTLYNTTDKTLDMSKYQLEYFNSYDLTKTSSSRLLALSGSVPPHGYFIVSDDSIRLCYQASVDSRSLGFSSTAGMVEIVTTEQVITGGPVSDILLDYVGWSKSGALGAQKLPPNTDAFLQRQPTEGENNLIITEPGAGSWQSVQYDVNDPCSLVSVADPSVYIPSGMSQLLPGTEPPATIIGTTATSSKVAVLPISDIGLKAPVINELLPNPTGSGNDKTDEFIELYNPNGASFDLSDFTLQTGATTTHSYDFPSGTRLPPHGFAAFYSATTKLSLSNSGGQTKLLDPFGNSISSSDRYSSAKDGNAWALAKGKWYWTIQPTPGRQNIIKQPAKTKKAAAKKTTTKQNAVKSKLSNVASQYGADNQGNDSAPIHLWTLAIIGGLALLYGAYEYRSDMANYFSQLRRNNKNRRGHGA